MPGSSAVEIGLQLVPYPHVQLGNRCFGRPGLEADEDFVVQIRKAQGVFGCGGVVIEYIIIQSPADHVRGGDVVGIEPAVTGPFGAVPNEGGGDVFGGIGDEG